MAECKICLNDEKQSFPIFFNDDICSACMNHHEDKNLNFVELTDEFLERISKTKSKYYKCVVPVFGDLDDWWLLEKLLGKGISVIVTWVNSYFNNEIAFQNYQNMVTYFDVDALTLNPNIDTYRNMVTKSLLEHDHILLPYQMLVHSFVANVALQNKIPYVIYPYNQPTEHAGTFSRRDRVNGNNWSVSEFNYLGLSPMNFCTPGSHLKANDLKQYVRPDDTKCSGKFEIEYFSNYCLYKPMTFPNDKNSLCLGCDFNATNDKFYRAGCGVYYETHDLLRFKKFGYIKARDHLSRSVRFKSTCKDTAQSEYHQFLSTERSNKAFYKLLNITASGEKWLENNYFDPIKRQLSIEINDTYNTKKMLPTKLYTKAIQI